MSSVFRHNNQQTFFLHSRQSQNTQFHFRFSGLKIVSSDFRTQKYEFSFPDKKIWVQLVFRTLILRYRLKKISRKKWQKIQSSKIVQTCFQHVLWHFFRKKNCPVFHGGSGFEKFQKKSKNFQNSILTKVVFRSVQTCFEHALRQFFRVFLPSVPCRAFQIFWT